MHFSIQNGMVGQVAKSGQAVYVNDTHQHAGVDRRITDAENIRSFIHVPIKVGGKIFGVFNVDYLQPRSFSEEDQRLINALWHSGQPLPLRMRTCTRLNKTASKNWPSCTLRPAAGQMKSRRCSPFSRQSPAGLIRISYCK
jgi:transcriptional regulator with GAF, ATPase, and Fis domain